MALQLFGTPRPSHHAGEYRRVRRLHGQAELFVLQVVELALFLLGLGVADQGQEGKSVSPLLSNSFIEGTGCQDFRYVCESGIFWFAF